MPRGIRGVLAAAAIAAIAAVVGHFSPTWLDRHPRAPQAPAPTATVQHSRPAARRAPEPDDAVVAREGAGRAASAEYRIDGAVSAVADGDTVTFRSGGTERKIRLDSIDAPELNHGSGQPGQPFGREARDFLAAWLMAKSVQARCYGKDQYGRELCDLVAADGASANREMVRAGMAWAYTAAQGKYLRDGSLMALQEEARQAKRGLWAQPRPVRPWQWRYDCWKQKQC